jgi:Ser/Thr protein kinase RdoA (MazF antagonist)
VKNQERLRKYKEVVIEALKEYDILYTQIEFFIEESNIFFKVMTKDSIYMVKIFQEESSKMEDNIAEIFFMKEIIKRTNIVIPNIISTREGTDIVTVKSKQFKTDKRVVVYDYMEGYDLNQHETDELFIQLGEVTATLHNMSENIHIPNDIHPKKWDTVFYYRDEPIVYNDPKYDKQTGAENRLFLDKFILYLNKQLPTYYSKKPFIIHADLNPWNVKVYNNTIRLLDFEEAMLATEVHDLAIILFYYRYDKNFDYDKVKKLLFKGYRKVRELPMISDFDIDLLIMARTANFVNYDLYWDENDPTEYFQSRCKRMMDFVEKYKIDLN